MPFKKGHTINIGRKRSQEFKNKIGDSNRGKTSWRKGLTAETDSRIKKRTPEQIEQMVSLLRELHANGKIQNNLQAYQEKVKSGEIKHPCKGRQLTDKEKEQISKSLQEGYKAGKIINPLGMLGKTASDKTKKLLSDNLKQQYADGKRDNIDVNNSFKSGYIEDLGHYVRSSWEEKVARILKSLNVNYQFEVKRFPIVINNESTTYLPDFYLTEYDLFLEVKGYKEKDIRVTQRKEAFENTYNKKVLLINSKVYQRLIKSEITTFEEFLNIVKETKQLTLT